MDISAYLLMIESHPVSVDALKWIAVILIAWAAGLFRYLRSTLKKPSIEIVSDASRCFIEALKDQNELKDITRATFIINAEVINPTSEKISVRYFRLRFSRALFAGFLSKPMHAISLPNRPRLQMGEDIKVAKVFFTNFSDGYDDLTVSGKIEPKDSQEAFLLFNSTTWGSWKPRVRKGKVKVELMAKLSTGEKLKVRDWIWKTEDCGFMEKWIPGILEYVAHPNTSNTYVDRGE